MYIHKYVARLTHNIMYTYINRKIINIVVMPLGSKPKVDEARAKLIRLFPRIEFEQEIDDRGRSTSTADKPLQSVVDDDDEQQMSEGADDRESDAILVCVLFRSKI
jgi:hypothetical protein